MAATTRIVINIVNRDNKIKVVTRSDDHGAMAQGDVKTQGVNFAELRAELHRQLDEVFTEMKDRI